MGNRNIEAWAVSFCKTSFCSFSDKLVDLNLMHMLHFTSQNVTLMCAFHVQLKSVHRFLHVICVSSTCLCRRELQVLSLLRKGQLNFSLSTLGTVCCRIEEDDTRKHSTGSLKPCPLLICLRRCFSVSLDACQGSSSSSGLYFFEGAAYSLASINLWFICQMR